MKLSEYIKGLQDILDKEGDIQHLYTSSGDEGNSFDKVYCEPEIRYLPEEEAGDSRPEYLIQKEDEEDFDSLVKVVLL